MSVASVMGGNGTQVGQIARIVASESDRPHGLIDHDASTRDRSSSSVATILHPWRVHSVTVCRFLQSGHRGHLNCELVSYSVEIRMTLPKRARTPAARGHDFTNGHSSYCGAPRGEHCEAMGGIARGSHNPNESISVK